MRLKITNTGPNVVECMFRRSGEEDARTLLIQPGEGHNIACSEFVAHDVRVGDHKVEPAQTGTSVPAPPHVYMQNSEPMQGDPRLTIVPEQSAEQGSSEPAPAPSTMNGLVGNGSIGG